MNNQAYLTKRTFIAITMQVSENFLKAFARIRKDFQGANIKWVDPGNLHLTLSFLGNTTALQMEQIKNRLNSIVSIYQLIEIRLKGLGVFKDSHRPLVLWAGIEAAPSLDLLYQDIQELITSVGFKGDKKMFKPHLTLGRIKTIQGDNNLKDILYQYDQMIDETILAERIVYYESILGSTGPKYIPLQKYALKT